MRETIFFETMDGIAIDRTVRDYEFTMPDKHFHEQYELYYLLEGQRYYFIEDKTYLVNAGNLVLIDHNQIHKTSSAGKPYHDRIVIEFSGDLIAPFFALFNDFSIDDLYHRFYGVITLSKEHQDYVKTSLLSIATEIHKKDFSYKSIAYMKLSQLLVFIYRCAEQNILSLNADVPQTLKHQKIQEITLYINENYTEVKSLDDLAKYFYISKCYLSRIFKETTGFTVNEYINIYKVKKAQSLLAHSDYNITQIANLLGYSNIMYFEKAFKKYTEMTPLKYRKKMSTYSLPGKKPRLVKNATDN